MRTQFAWLIHVALGVWFLVCCVGFGALLVYSNSEGAAGEPSDSWPLSLEIELDHEHLTLVVFAHPRCPCTRATFAELERLQVRTRRPFVTKVIFYEPADADAGWRETDLWRRARALPDATAHADPGGRLIQQCGAMTSGTAALYTPDGVLCYWGGLTVARGHEGDNVGLLALIDRINNGGGPPTRFSVFGCALLSDIDLRDDVADRT